MCPRFLSLNSAIECIRKDVHLVKSGAHDSAQYISPIRSLASDDSIHKPILVLILMFAFVSSWFSQLESCQPICDSMRLVSIAMH